MSDRLQTLLDRLPRLFYTALEEDSVIYKLMKIVASATEETRNVYDTIQRFWDIDQAYGIGLDRLGKDEGIARDGMDDEEYRKMIKIQCILNMSDGDIPTMNLILDAYFGENFIGLEEGWRVFDEPATLVANLHQIPFNIPYKMLKRLKPAGVGMILGTKQKIDLGLNIGAAYPSYQKTTLKVAPFIMPDLSVGLKLGLVNASYKKTTLLESHFEMPNLHLAHSFGGVFSIHKTTIINMEGVV